MLNAYYLFVKLFCLQDYVLACVHWTVLWMYVYSPHTYTVTKLIKLLPTCLWYLFCLIQWVNNLSNLIQKIFRFFSFFYVIALEVIFRIFFVQLFLMLKKLTEVLMIGFYQNHHCYYFARLLSVSGIIHSQGHK